MSDSHRLPLCQSTSSDGLRLRRRRHLSRLIALSLLCLAPVCLQDWQRSRGASAQEAHPVADARALKPGDSVTVELKPGGVLSFEIPLGRQQALDLSVEKGDLNLSLALYRREGQPLIEHTSRRYETMEGTLVAELPCMCRLEMRSLEQIGQGRPATLTVGSARPAAMPRDRKAATAWSLAAEAARLRGVWEEASLRAAFEKYEAASQTWRSARDSRRAAAALMEAAEVRFNLGEYRESLVLYRKAAAHYRGGDKAGEARAVSQIGRLYSYLGDNDEALRHVKRALGHYAQQESSTAQQQRLQAEALSNAGEVYYSKENFLKTSALFGSALELFAQVGDRSGEARARIFIGHVSNATGQREKALAEFKVALALYRAVGDRSGEAFSLMSLGITHSLGREETKALELHGEALEIFRRIGDRQSEAITLNGIGQAHENLHEYEIALVNYKQALKHFESSGSLDFASATLYQIAAVHRALGNSQQALVHYEQCARLSHAARKRRTEVYAHSGIAAVYASQGKKRQTLGQYQKILRFYKALGDQRGQALTLNDIGDFFLSLGDAHAAYDSYAKALKPARLSSERGVEIDTLYNLARAARDRGRVDEALSLVEQSIDIIEALRVNVASPEFRSSYVAGVHKHFELRVDLLMSMDRQRPQQGFHAAALLVAESARARSLLDLLSEVGVDIRRDAEPGLLKREHELQQLLRAQAQYQLEVSAGGTAAEDAAEATRGMEQLRAEYQEVLSKLRRQNPRVASLMQPKPLSLEALRAEVGDENTLLLEYALGDERSYLWALTADSLTGHELPARATIEEAAREFHSLLTARQLEVDAGYRARVEESDRLLRERSRDLSRMLLGPVAGELGDKRLVVVVEGVLQFIPFDALPTPVSGEAAAEDMEPLVARHEVVFLPSVSTLAAIRREKVYASPPGKILAVLADPVFGNNDGRVQDTGASHPSPAPPADELSQRALRDFQLRSGRAGAARLTHTSEEADAILASIPRGMAMSVRGFEASRETALNPELGQYRILHFATHGFVNSEHPELSGIMLSMVRRNGEPADGFLQLHDIYNMRLSADLVVLSACDTGRGKDIKGEGLNGLMRGFMYAGSKSVVASLWKVDDRATAELMGYFYEAMLREGMPVAAALREAKQKMRRQERWSAPYFWAGFVLQGEYRERVEVGQDSGRAALAVLVVAPIMLAAGFIIYKTLRRTRGLP